MASSDHNLFFASRVENGIAHLDGEECRHVTSVLRLTAGDTIQVTDGKGTIYECRIPVRASGALSCEVVSTKQVPKPRPIVRMCIGMCDRDRFEECAENCAALGAGRIVPLVCRFGQKPWWEAWDKHAQRINRKLIAGIKQSHNPWLPALDRPTAFSDAVSAAGASLVLTADTSGGPFLGVVDKIQQAAAVSCFVGPPGGFSPEELDILRKAEAGFVSLSQNRLRTELVAAVLCGAVTMMTNRYNLPL
jgi:16S rRNA (uracil1498-N3)-methyltransferase